MSEKMKVALDSFLEVPDEGNPDGETHAQAGEEDSTESRYETKESPLKEDNQENQTTLAEGLVEQVVQGVEQANYTERQIDDGRAFLEKYAIDTSEMSPSDVIEKLRKIQHAKEDQAQVLSRGQILDGLGRLLSFVPKGQVGQFFSNDDVSVQRGRALGWKVFVDEKVRDESLTGESDGAVTLGDQILMIIPEEQYVGTLLAKAERFKARRESREHQPEQGDEHLGADPLFPIQKL